MLLCLPKDLNELDQLPLPPVAGEVVFQGIAFVSLRVPLRLSKMLVFTFLQVPLLGLLDAVAVGKAPS